TILVFRNHEIQGLPYGIFGFHLPSIPCPDAMISSHAKRHAVRKGEFDDGLFPRQRCSRPHPFLPIPDLLNLSFFRPLANLNKTMLCHNRRFISKARVRCEGVLHLTYCRERGVPEPRLTVLVHALRHFLEHGLRLFLSTPKTLEKLLIHFDRDVRTPMVLRVAFALHEVVDIWVSPMLDTHPRASADISAHDAGGELVINRHH